MDHLNIGCRASMRLHPSNFLQSIPQYFDFCAFCALLFPIIVIESHLKMVPALSAFKQTAIEKLAISLNLPGLPLHINTVLLSAGLYFSIYTFIGPWLLRNKAPFDYASLPRTRRVLWNDWTASISQSFINTGMALYLMLFQRADPQSPQERMLGYDSQVATVTAVLCGYFCFHVYQTTKDIDIDGYLMSLHAIASIIGAVLGFVRFFPFIFLKRQSSHFNNLCIRDHLLYSTHLGS